MQERFATVAIAGASIASVVALQLSELVRCLRRETSIQGLLSAESPVLEFAGTNLPLVAMALVALFAAFSKELVVPLEPRAFAVAVVSARLGRVPPRASSTVVVAATFVFEVAAWIGLPLFAADQIHHLSVDDPFL